MPSIQSYKAKCSLSLVSADNEELPIFGAYLSSVGTTYDYSTNIMPILNIILNTSTDVYDQIVKNATDGKIQLTVSIYDNNTGGIGIEKEIISDQFAYFLPAKYNFAKKIEDPGVSDNISSGETKEIVLGLMKAELIEANKHSFNANIMNTDTEKILEKIIKYVPGLTKDDIDPVENNKEYPTFTMPPQDSVLKALDYLFNESPFYNTKYNFFMDFKKSYLVNSAGLPRTEKLAIHTVLFKINSIGLGAENITGIAKDAGDGIHIIYALETDVNYNINTTTEKGANQIVAYDTDEITKVDLNIFVSKESTTNKQSIERANQLATDIRKQLLDNTTVTLQIFKMNMDTSIITPDRCYQVVDDKYPDYNGRYILLYKQDIFARAGDGFDASTMIGLQRIADQ